MSEENASWVQRPVRRLPRPPKVAPHPAFPENLEQEHLDLVAQRLSEGKARKSGNDLEARILKFKKEHGIRSHKSKKIDKETWDAIFTRPVNAGEPFQAIPVTEEEMHRQEVARGGTHQHGQSN